MKNVATIIIAILMGYGVSGSANYSQSKMNADYASVREQTGIFAGDDGYQVNVKGHTQLDGALITSTAQAEAERKNSFRTGTIDYRDIENHANYSGSSVGIGGGFSVGGGDGPKELGGVKLASQGQNHAQQSGDPNSGKGKAQASITGLGFGSDSSHAGGVTKSGINTQNIEITDHRGQLQRTGNSVQTALEGIRTDITTETAQAHSGSVTNRFDKDALQKELDIQRTTTEAFGKNAAQAVALASEKFGKVKEYQVIEHQKVLAEQALNQETDPGKRAELTRTIDLAEDYLKTYKAEYETWKEGGVGRVALHAVAGGLLTGNLSGAVASGTTSAAAPHLEELSKELGDVGKAIIDIGAGAAIGAVTGAMTGGGVSAVSAGGNTDWHNRQLHPNEVARIKELAGDDKEKELRLTIAACALVHCSAQIPSDSAQYSDAYTNAKMLEDLGNSAEFEAERTLLSKQYELMTDSWGAGVKKPLFDYNFAYAGLDYAAAKDSKYALMTRTGGALQAVGGAVTIVGSYSGAAATCVASSGLGCGLAAGAGSVGATIGADHLDTGVKTLIDGKAYPTTGAKLLSDVTGISLDNAELIYGFADITYALPKMTNTYSEVLKLANESKMNKEAHLSYTPIDKFKPVGIKGNMTSLKDEIEETYILMGYSKEQAYKYTDTLIQSGMGDLQKFHVSNTTSLIKLVPKGDGVSAHSPFFMSFKEYEKIKNLPPSKISEFFGLPAEQGVRGSQFGFDVYQITPNTNDLNHINVYKSLVAEIIQGEYKKTGGGEQILVPNRKQWSNPIKIEEIKGERFNK